MQLSLTMHKSAMENCKKIKIITNNDNFKKKKNMMNNFEKIKGKKNNRHPTKTMLEKNIAVALRENCPRKKGNSKIKMTVII